MPGLVQPDFMYVYVDKKVGVKRRFFMSLGMSVPLAGSFHGLHKVLWRDFVVDGGIWSIDLKSHWMRAVEMSRIGPIELVG